MIPMTTPCRFVSRKERSPRGVASLLLVSLVMLSILVGLALSNWIGIQRRGDMQMRVAMKEIMLAQSAVQETRLRLIDGTIGTGCVRGVPSTFTYYVARSTVTVTIDCDPFP